jgi:hypothetical protein
MDSSQERLWDQDINELPDGEFVTTHKHAGPPFGTVDGATIITS